jgi:hypothetical protein
VGHLGLMTQLASLSQSLGDLVSNAEVAPALVMEAEQLVQVRYASQEWAERR